MIRALVAEDSATAREALLAILATDGGIEVLGVAANGAEAVALTQRLRPDIVTMDVHMPELDGYEATRRIMAEAPTPILIVSASTNLRDAQASLNALRAGALGVCEKPSLSDDAEAAQGRARFLATVRALADVKVVRRTPPASLPARRAPRSPRCEVVAIAASTGGPAALAQLVARLPSDLPVPLIAVQHNTVGFMPALASWLNGCGNLRVRVAGHGDVLERGTLHLAPDGHHLGIDAGGRVTLDGGAAIRGFRPSASFLFGSIGRCYGPRALAAILTGMGTDGTEGLRQLHAAGGLVIAQDEASSVVFGMPAAAIAAGVVDEVVPLDELATRICAAVGWSG